MVVPIPARPPTFLVADEPEVTVMTAALAESVTDREGAIDFEQWKYMGTWFLKGAWHHHFRRQGTPTGAYLSFPASDGWEPKDASTRLDMNQDSTGEN